MNEKFFAISYHLPYLHVYIVAFAAIIFAIISFAKNYLLRQNPKRVLTFSPNLVFVGSQIILFFAMISPFYLAGNGKYIFDQWIDDNFLSAYSSALILVLSFLSMFYIYEAIRKINRHIEFYCSFYFMLFGLMLICISQQFVYSFVGLAITTISIYFLLFSEQNKNINDDKKTTKPTSINSSLIVFVIIGSISVALFAFGASWLYGATGSMFTREYYDLITKAMIVYRPYLEIGTMFIIVAIAIQFGLAPFHQWVIRLYESTSYPIAMLVMNITKIAIFVLTMRIVINSLFSFAEFWKWMVLTISLISIIYGFWGMFAQKSFRRFLAYSAIANLGFVFITMYAVVEIRAGGEFISGNAVNAISSDLFYLIFYQFTNNAVFAFAWVLAKNGVDNDNIENFRGLHTRYPWFAFMFATLMLSMAGVPPFLGFWARLAVVQALLGANHQLIILVAVIFSIMGIMVYFRFIWLMYFEKPLAGYEEKITLSKPFRLVLSLHCILLIVLALFPAVPVQTVFLIMQ